MYNVIIYSMQKYCTNNNKTLDENAVIVDLLLYDIGIGL